MDDIKIGDNIIYNGKIEIRGKFVIKNNYGMIHEGYEYRIMDIMGGPGLYYYKIITDIKTSWWYPAECFYKDNNRNYISYKYNLK